MEVLRDHDIGAVYSSPYARSLTTVEPIAELHNLKIKTDERLRERQAGSMANNYELFQKRWNDLSFCEEGGESIGKLQRRNIQALFEILSLNTDKEIVIGTHGSAFSSILKYFNEAFGVEDFMRIIDLMPYVVRMDFDSTHLVQTTEVLSIKKEYKPQ